MEYIKETGISFKPGEQLTAAKLEKLNTKINELVVVVNKMLKGLCDINVELNDFSRKFDLSEAITIVSNTRRIKGMKIRFLSKNDKYVEFSYTGETLDTSDWTNTNNWTESLDVVDGGEWE